LAGGGRRSGWAAWAKEAKQDGWLAGLKLKRISFLNKNWIFEYTKALEIYTRRFRGNFDVGLLKDFRKIKYARPCILCKIIFLEGFFYTRGNLICNLYALLCWQNFIFAKSGCYKPTLLRGISPSIFKKHL
jgi:hypothetical protein